MNPAVALKLEGTFAKKFAASYRSASDRPTILIAAAGSLIYSIFIFIRLLTDGIADLPDRIAYGAVPIASYTAGLVAAYLLLTDAITASLDVIAGASLVLLVVNIRNAWDLMLALARRVRQEQQRPPGI